MVDLSDIGQIGASVIYTLGQPLLCYHKLGNNYDKLRQILQIGENLLQICSAITNAQHPKIHRPMMEKVSLET